MFRSNDTRTVCLMIAQSVPVRPFRTPTKNRFVLLNKIETLMKAVRMMHGATCKMLMLNEVLEDMS